jgi:hypothetical protein
MKQTEFYPCLYTSWISAQTHCGFEGSAVKGGYCQGFTKSHSGSDLNGLRPKGLKEYSDNYLASDYLGPVLKSK